MQESEVTLVGILETIKGRDKQARAVEKLEGVRQKITARLREIEGKLADASGALAETDFCLEKAVKKYGVQEGWSCES